MQFKGIQKTLKFTQYNQGNINEVFPLLCPVREKDWLDGWDYTMIYSESGYAEQDCVFSTPNPTGPDTIWQITQYDPELYRLEFIRVTSDQNVVKINIQLLPEGEEVTIAQISYQYTGLSEEQNKYIENDLDRAFDLSMQWWEAAINHYLTTGKKLLRE